MKKTWICLLVVVLVVLMLVGGFFYIKKSKVESNANNNYETKEKIDSKRDESGTAGSNIPLKDNNEEAEYQIKVAMQKLLEEAYGDKVFDARIYVKKIYSYEDEQEEPSLKEMKLGPNEVAFEVNYEIKPSAGVDPNQFTAGTGYYDEESGWVVEKYNLGILKFDGNSNYEITNFGTGW